MAAVNRSPLYLLAAASRAYDAAHALQTCPDCGATWFGFPGCDWCTRRRQADHDHILKPPPERGYGYATDDDLHLLGYDRARDRAADLERWRHDLELAVDARLITQTEGETAWQSVNKNQASTSSTGTTCTTGSTPPTTPSSTASPTPAGGPPSPHQRKRANRRLSSPSQWKPQ